MWGHSVADVITFDKRGRIAVIAVRNPPVNALSHAVRSGLLDKVEEAAGKLDIDAIIVTGAGRTFPAGADIREFDQPMEEPGLLSVINRFDAIQVPIIAALHGTVLGGGLELALGCHYRVALPDTMIGLPEVKLGVFPGASGTQRLPRVAGLDHALELIVSGEPIDAKKALEYGIVDKLINGDLLDSAVEYTRNLTSDTVKLRISSHPKEPIARPEAFAETIKKYTDYATQRMRGQRSPLEALESVIDGLRMPYDEAVAADSARFARLKDSEQSKALRYAFFAERLAGKIPDMSEDVEPRRVRKAAVIGAGTMGTGIAISLADAGYPVAVIESSTEALNRGMTNIRATYQALADRGRIDSAEMARRVGVIQGGIEYGAIREADLIVEAAFEDMEAKKKIFALVDSHAKPGAVLATNTSYMDIDAIAATINRPQDVIGMHFFAPANIMKLVEIVRGKDSAPDAVATGMAVTRAMGKVGALAGVSHGFVANRSRAPLVREAIFLVEEGASPHQVDKVLTEFGMPMGPLAVSDLSGLDVSYRMRQSLADQRDPDERYVHLADRLCEMKRIGRKAGKGWYSYGEGGRTPVPDPEVDEIAAQVAEEQGIERRQIGADEILERCLYAAVNEGAKIIEEGIALRAGDIDVMWLYGFGFPRWRGGIMYYADQVGLPNILSKIEGFHDAHGKLWAPADLLRKLAGEGGNFTSGSA